MWFMSNIYQALFISILIATYDVAKCDAITNTHFNSHIRDYSKADISNVTNVKTLQKEELGRYETFTPAGSPIKFKEIPDSALSSSNNGRGFLYHDQPGYSLNEYEEGPHYPHGHDYHLYDPHLDVHGPHAYNHDHSNHYDHHEHQGHLGHHDPHEHYYSGHNNVDHGHYNKHYKHALAAKAVLWPIAGIALLGAAAALVSNPVLLQLGVISGKRRRRDTEEITGPDFPTDTFTKYADKIKIHNNGGKVIETNKSSNKISNQDEKANYNTDEIFKRRALKTGDSHVKHIAGIRKIRSSVKRNVDKVTTYPGKHNNNNEDDKFIPIAIKLRTPKSIE